jgi:hypothetical protein
MHKNFLMTRLHINSYEKNQVSELRRTVRVYDVKKCPKRDNDFDHF